MSKHTIIIATLAGLSLLRSAGAQTGAVPPLETPESLKREKEAKEEAILSTAVALPMQIIKGSAVLNQQMGLGSSVQQMGVGNSIGNAAGKAVAGAKILNGTYKDGVEGFEREGAQFVIDSAAEEMAKAAVQRLTLQTVASGVSATVASGGASLAFTGGTIFGTYLRNSPVVGHSIGLKGTIGDEVDNVYFAITPDWVKEQYSGVKQVDLNDPQVWKKMEDDARRRRWQNTFNSVQQENAEQQRQMAAYATATAAENQASAEPAPAGPDASQIFMQALLGSTAPPAPAKSSPALSSVPKACKLDPATGCHPGHDEKSHPGGCKAC